MSNFVKVRLVTLISTCIITYLFTGDIILSSGLSAALIITNTIIMYLLIK